MQARATGWQVWSHHRAACPSWKPRGWSIPAPAAHSHPTLLAHPAARSPRAGLQCRSRGTLVPAPPNPNPAARLLFHHPTLRAGRTPGWRPKVRRRPRALGRSAGGGRGQAGRGAVPPQGRVSPRRAGGVRPRAAGLRSRRLPAGAGTARVRRRQRRQRRAPSRAPHTAGSPPPRRGFAPFSRPLRFLSSSGSYSFPARKQPCLLKKPPWPQSGPGLGTRALPA